MSSSLSITGKVTDQNSLALPEVVISVDGEGIDTTIVSVADAEGNFELRNLPPPGQYLLSANMDGYMDWKKPVVVQPDTPFIANITMYFG